MREEEKHFIQAQVLLEVSLAFAVCSVLHVCSRGIDTPPPAESAALSQIYTEGKEGKHRFPIKNSDSMTECSLPTFVDLIEDHVDTSWPGTVVFDDDQKVNLSGASYDPDRDSLWVVRNNPQQLYEVDANTLKQKRQLDLQGFVDTEASHLLAFRACSVHRIDAPGQLFAFLPACILLCML